MKLALRFLVAAIVPVSLIILGNGFLRVKREIRLLTEEVAIHQRAMGRALAAGVEQVWAEGGDDAARRLTEAAAARDELIDLTWVARARGELAALPPSARTQLEQNKVFVVGSPGGEGRLRSLVPVVVDGAMVGAIEMSEVLEREDAYLQATVVRVAANTLIAIVAVSLIMVLMGWFFVARRVGELVRLVRRIGEGRDEEGETILPEGRDEIGQLAREIRDMQCRLTEARRRLSKETEERVRAVEQLRHADRLTAVGQLAGGMAHELGTPLNVALGRARMLQEGVPAEKQNAYLDVIIRQIERISGIVRQVLDFSRRATPSARAVDLQDVAVDTVRLLEPEAKKAGVELEVAGRSAMAWADPVQIDQVITNLVINAIHACSRGDRVVISTDDVEVAEGRPPRSVITVRDSGPGIPPDVIEKVFDPFFTTKDVGEGTGLGLSVAHGIITEHEGTIAVESEPGAGTTFTIELPRKAP